jgi:hypothetical protein
LAAAYLRGSVGYFLSLAHARMNLKLIMKFHHNCLMVKRIVSRTLLTAVYAYMQDYETIGVEAAWLALPPFEQERLREASRYFPVDIPEDWNVADMDDDGL